MLANSSTYQASLAEIEAVAKRVKMDQLERYIYDTQKADDSDEICACLMIAKVVEEEFEDAEEAYEEINIRWEFASRHLTKLVMAGNFEKWWRFGIL